MFLGTSETARNGFKEALLHASDSHPDLGRAPYLLYGVKKPYMLYRVKIDWPGIPFTGFRQDVASDSRLDLDRVPYCYVLYGVEYIGLVSLTSAATASVNLGLLDLGRAPYCFVCTVFNLLYWPSILSTRYRTPAQLLTTEQCLTTTRGSMGACQRAPASFCHSQR